MYALERNGRPLDNGDQTPPKGIEGASRRVPCVKRRSIGGGQSCRVDESLAKGLEW